MRQEAYELSILAGVDSFMSGLETLLQDKAAEAAERGDTAIYIHLLFSMMEKDMARQIREKIQAIMPQAVVTGMSETVFGMEEKIVGVKLNFSFFAASKVELFTCSGELADYGQAGQQLGKRIAALPEVKAAAVYCSGMSTEVYAFVREMAADREDIVFFGAIAGMFEYVPGQDNSKVNIFAFNKRNRLEQQYVMGEALEVCGIVVAVFCGEDLHVQGDYIFGWHPLGKEMTITETCGANGIARIDDMPATEIYHRYLNVIPDDNFVFNISEFPLGIERNGCLIARVPPRYDEQGRLFFGADVYQGEKLQLTYAVHDDLLQNTEKHSETMCDFAPQGIFLTVCGNRFLFLKEKAQEEISFYRRFDPQLAVNYGTAEIYCYQGQGGILNSAFVSVALREGPPQPSVCYRDYRPRNIPEHRIIPLAERMAVFLAAVTQELADMAKAAQAANVAKSQFLSSMSHEIRTPINAVLGMDELILRETREQSTREYAENIRTAGNTLLGLINDILDFSKIEAGKMELIPTEYALSSLLNDLVMMIAARAEKKGLTLKVVAAENLPSILYGDELRLRQIITNILTNAVKYTEQGSITLMVEGEKIGPEEISLRVAIEDTGIGIKPEDKAKLFEAFARIEEERNRTIEGTGLGMNITQHLLGLMDSRLEVESTYGEGSTFGFRVKQKVLNWQPMGNYEEAYRRTMAEHPVEKEHFVAPAAQVLVVDDTPMNLTVVRGLLKQTRIQVDTAVSGFECLEMAGKKGYDMIFLDHRMPGMDGMETLQALRRQQEMPCVGTPIIALTANAVAGAREEYLAAGFDDYLTKPIDSQRLEECLLRFLPADKVEKGLPQEGQKEEGHEAVLPDWLKEVADLDIEAGINHCGSAEAYLTALTVFAGSLPAMAAEIERFFLAADCPNYTTKVHALKSTAKVAGLTELSERARRLENAGNNGYVNEIKADTPIMLELCREYAKRLAPLAAADEPDVKAEISPEGLAEAWESLREVAQAFDYDSLSYILTELSQYALPQADEARLQAVRQAADRLAWEEIRKLTDGH